ncbi:hypothetical protein BN961_02520 [Afipia felis]|uniref:Uncharacterized protein n=1 Tax=Afipia felis TaxID=1035 RepID=A0A090MTX9_AFIFE|nr:conserved hypothetical protein [Afipia sp. 1NLS2]CEG09099.1 hypothetical protein BN961_02520 [Afipia felis]
MHTSSSFSDNSLFPHAPCDQNLTEHVVDLVGTRVVQLVAFKVYFGAFAVVCQTLGEVQRAGSAYIVFEIEIHLALEQMALARFYVHTLQLENERH